MSETHRDDPARSAPPRLSIEPWQRALDAVLGTIAAGICVLLLSTACPKEPPTPSPFTETAVDIRVNEQEQSDMDPTMAESELTDDDPFGEAAGTATVGSSILGGSVAGTVELAGEDAEGFASAEQEICFDATHTTNPDLFSINSLGIEMDCDVGTDAVEIEVLISMAKNGGAPLIIYSGSASAACGATSITSSGFAPFIASIPNFRWGSSHQPQFPDVVSVVPGDRITLVEILTLHGNLPPGGPGSIEITGTQSATFDFGLQKVGCAAAECDDHSECPEGWFCYAGTCRPQTFASPPLNLDAATSPNPLIPGQPFSFSFEFDLHQSDLQPFAIEVSIPPAALTWTGVAAFNAIVGGCSAGPFNFNVLTTLDANQLYIDRDGNFAFGAPDVSIAIDTAGKLDVVFGIPNGGDGDPAAPTLPMDATFSCQGFFGMFSAGSPGSHQIDVDATAVDIDTGGADDEAGFDPPETSAQFILNIPGEPLCGTAPGESGLGAPGLEASYDVDGNGSVTALSDGVLILRHLFGFTGPTLVSGALGGGATRTDPAIITEYLDCLATEMLDIDDNDSIDFMTDGVLILRHLFGLTGTPLTNGALGLGAMRTEPADLVDFMNQFIP